MNRMLKKIYELIKEEYFWNKQDLKYSALIDTARQATELEWYEEIAAPLYRRAVHLYWLLSSQIKRDDPDHFAQVEGEGLVLTCDECGYDIQLILNRVCSKLQDEEWDYIEPSKEALLQYAQENAIGSFRQLVLI